MKRKRAEDFIFVPLTKLELKQQKKLTEKLEEAEIERICYCIITDDKSITTSVECECQPEIQTNNRFLDRILKFVGLMES